MAEYESQIGSEYLGGSTPIPGGTEIGGISIHLSYPPQPNIDSAVGIHAFGDCQILALGRLVRYEGMKPVWRLTDVLAMPNVQADEFTHLQCVGADSDPATSNEKFIAVVRKTDQTTYTPSSAWRVDPDRGFQSVDPNIVRCPILGDD